jgi:DNA adenine methylase
MKMKEVKNIKISPIFYMGNKKKLINKGLTDLFPKDIDTFIDIFAGSGIVPMNTIANKYIINDIDENLFRLYSLFKDNYSDDIINHIEQRIEEYSLPKERTRRIEFKDDEKIEQYKLAYTTFRSYYNETKNVLDFYTLMFFSFSQQFRFNSTGGFNMPYGNDCFSETNKEYIRNGCEFFNQDNVKIFSKDFKTLKIDKLNQNDFVYLDPPYLNTTATYNENGGWNIDDEDTLYDMCERLSAQGIKWGMSNVFENKGIKSQKLIEWCDKNDFNVFTFDKVSYSACGKGNSNAQEVYICNY